MSTFKISPEDQKRVKALGFLKNKNTEDEFSCRIITVNGKITADQTKAIGEAAEKFGKEVTFTSRLTVEINGVPFDKIDDIRAFLKDRGLETGGTGSKIRPVVSCKGTTCQFGLIDTFDISEAVHNDYFVKWNDVKTPHKFKVAVGGCPNSCVKPDLNDMGIIGQLEPNYDQDGCMGCKVCPPENICPMGAAKVNPEEGVMEIDKEKCNNCGLCVGKCNFDCIPDGNQGYQITFGGIWGKRKHQGVPVPELLRNKEDVLKTVEKCMLVFREQGQTGERLHDTANRIGYDKFIDMVMSDDILDRKEEILAANLHTVGGATC